MGSTRVRVRIWVTFGWASQTRKVDREKYSQLNGSLPVKSLLQFRRFFSSEQWKWIWCAEFCMSCIFCLLDFRFSFYLHPLSSSSAEVWQLTISWGAVSWSILQLIFVTLMDGWISIWCSSWYFHWIMTSLSGEREREGSEFEVMEEIVQNLHRAHYKTRTEMRLLHSRVKWDKSTKRPDLNPDLKIPQN